MNAVVENPKFIDCALFILLNWSTIETIFNSVDDALGVLLLFLTNAGAQSCFDFINSIFGRSLSNPRFIDCALFILLNWSTIENIFNSTDDALAVLLLFLTNAGAQSCFDFINGIFGK